MDKYVCTICGYIYDEASGEKWEQLGDNWTCPLCGAKKDQFEKQEGEIKSDIAASNIEDKKNQKLEALSYGELSAVFSNLAKGCEKQFKAEETECFNKLSEYYMSKSSADSEKEIETKLEEDMASYAQAKASVGDLKDRGALRALVWSEKVSRIISSILKRYDKQKADLFKDKNIYVCEICGFIYIGNEASDICPVCKVQKFKINEIKREAI